MKGIYVYIWIINKRNVKFNLIKNSMIIIFIIALVVSAKKYILFNSEQAGFLILIFLSFVLLTNANFFTNNYAKINLVRFDRFIATTSVGYRSLLMGLMSSNLLLNTLDFFVCILVLGLLKKIVFATSFLNEFKMLLFAFLIYTIWTLLLVPLFVYFEDNKTAVLMLTFACMGLNIFYLKNHSLKGLLISSSLLILLVVICILLFFVLFKVTENLWKYGD